MRKIRAWVHEYAPLMEAFWVAISAHILLFPVVWCIGWALPWPKSPEILTIIEYDLTDYFTTGPKQIKVTDIMESLKHGRKKK